MPRPIKMETMALLPRKRISLVLLLFGSLAAACLPLLTAGAAPLQSKGKAAATSRKTQPPPEPDLSLRSIKVEGNKILAGEAIVAASGLKTGEKVDKAVFDAAQAKLLASGFFETVGYRYNPTPDNKGYNATLEVQEVQPLLSVRIEALPEPSDAVVAWLRQADPFFTGKLPGTEQVLARTTREVEQYLASKNHPEKVTAKVVALSADKLEIQIQPARGLASVADVTFTGNKALPSTQLGNAIADVAFGQPYTEAGFRQLLDHQIRPRYEAKGYLKVQFTKVVATPSTRVKGVDVNVTIEEGPQYKLTRVALAGKVGSDSARILKAAKIPQMTIADFDEIKLAADRVKDEMKHRGYLDAQVTIDRKLDEAKKSVEVFLVVETGPEFHFRKLTVQGLGLDGEAAIRKMWGLKPGDVFPAEYPNYFVGKVKEEGLFDNLGDTAAATKRDPSSNDVDVTLNFKFAPPKPERRPRHPADDPPGS